MLMRLIYYLLIEYDVVIKELHQFKKAYTEKKNIKRDINNAN